MSESTDRQKSAQGDTEAEGARAAGSDDEKTETDPSTDGKGAT